MSDLGAYDAALKAHFRRVARADTEIVMHGMQPGTYPTNYPGTDLRHAGVQHLHSMQLGEAALAAEGSGFDAYAISTLPDPAQREFRSLVRIPVVGYGEGGTATVIVTVPETMTHANAVLLLYVTRPLSAYQSQAGSPGLQGHRRRRLQ